MKKFLFFMTLLLAFCVPWAHGQTLFYEGFESTTGSSLPTGWTQEGPGVWSVGTGDHNTSTGSYAGSKNVFIKHGTTGYITKVITPAIDCSGKSNVILTFAYINRDWNPMDYLTVYYRTSSLDSWHQIEHITAAHATWTLSEEYTIPSSSSSTLQVAFEMTDRYGYGVGIDEVMVVPAPACSPLQSLYASDITRTSITANWTKKTVATNCVGYEVKISTSSNPDDVGVSTAIIDNPATTSYVFSNLERNTTYYLHAHPNCGEEDGYGDWISASVTTKSLNDCSNAVTVAEGTETSSYLPVYGNYCDYVQKSQSIYPESMLTGLVGKTISKLKYYVSSGSSANWQNATFKIRMMHTSASTVSSFINTADATLVYSGTLMATVADGMEITLTTPFTYTGGNLLIEFELPFETGYTPCSFYGASATSASRYEYEGYSGPTGSTQNFLPKVDFGYCETVEACPAVTNLAISDIAQTTASISWTASTGDYANTYDVLVSTTPVVDFTGVIPRHTSLTGTTDTLQGLSAYTDYYVYVRVNCNARDHNDGEAWSEVAQFKTLSYCVTPTEFNVEPLTKRTAMATWTPYEGQTSNYRYILSEEVVANPDGAETTETGITNDTILLEDLTPGQHYYLYISNDCGGSDGVSPYIMTEFTMPEACVAPDTVFVSDIQKYQMTLNWTPSEYADPTDIYDILVSEKEILDFVGIMPTYSGVTGTSKVLDVLQRNTTYYVYIRCNCGEGGNTDWSAAVSGKTLDLAPDCNDLQTVAVGNGSNSSQYVPANAYYNYAISEQIYTASEIGHAGTIKNLSFYCTQNGGYYRNFTVYLAHTSKSSFSSQTDWVTVSASDAVYSGSHYVTSGAWNTITFTTPFEYNGTDNLLVVIDDNSGNYQGTYATYRTHTADGNKSLYHYADGTNVDPTASSISTLGTTSNTRNNMQFGFCSPSPACPTLAVPAVASDVDVETATLTWNEGEGDFATTYNVVVSKEPVNDFYAFTDDYVNTDDAKLYKNVPDTTLDLDSLVGGTDYYAYVRVNCINDNYDDGVSGWSGQCKFHTERPCRKPKDFTIDVTNSTSVQFSWVKTNADSWQIERITGEEKDTVDITSADVTIVADTVTYVMDNLKTKSEYSFRLRGTCGEELGKSDWAGAVEPTVLNTVTLDSIARFLTFGISTANEAFQIGETEFVQDTIKITMRRDNNLSALVPVFTLAGQNAIVKVNGEKQTSGVSEVDFSDEVAYTIFAEDRNVTKTIYVKVATEDCATPYNLVVENIGRRSADIRWNVYGTPENYQVVLSTTEVTDFDAAAKINFVDADMLALYEARNLDREQKYYFYVRTVCDGSYSSWARKEFTTNGLGGQPACPDIETVSVALTGEGTNSATLTWSASTADYVGYYEVIKSTEQIYNFTGIQPDASNLQNTQYAFTGLTPYTTYYFYVRCVCGHGDGASNWIGTSVKTNANCRIVSDLSVTVNSKTQATATWTPGSATQSTNFRYVLSDEQLDYPDAVTPGRTGITSARAVITDLTPGTTYYLYVGNDCGGGNYSPYVETSFTMPDACIAPVNLAVDEVGKYDMSISWENSQYMEADNDKYEVLVSEHQIAGASFVDTAAHFENVTGTSLAIDGLDRETHYYIYMRGMCGDIYGDWVNVDAETEGLGVDCDNLINILVANGTTTNSCLPVYGYYMDNPIGMQSVYPASKLTDVKGKTISKLHYYVSSGSGSSWGTKPLKVYMAEVSNADLENGFLSITGLTPVYDGNIVGSSVNTTNGMTITLDQPYTYNGGNLLIAMQANPDGLSGYSSVSFYGVSSTNASRYGYGMNNYNFTDAGTNQSFLPKVEFSVCTPIPACPAVDKPVVTNVKERTATISWNEGEGDWTSSYDVIIAKSAINCNGVSDSFEGNADTIVYRNVTATTLDVQGLTADNTYYAYVRVNCKNDRYDDGTSVWSAASDPFVTELACLAPKDFVAANVRSHSVSFTWTDINENAVAWILEAKKSGAAIWDTTIVDIDGVTKVADTVAYTLAGLDANKTYSFRLTADCGEDSLSKNNNMISNVRTLNDKTDINVYNIVSSSAPGNIVMGNITNDTTAHTVAITLRADVDLTELAAKLNISNSASLYVNGERQYPISINAFDYSSPVVYHVVAEDTAISQDWTVSVQHETCPTVYGVAAENIARRTADIVWNVAESSTQFDIKVSTTPLTSPEEFVGFTTFADAEHTGVHTLTGLTRNTRYYVYLRSHCGSEWVDVDFWTQNVSGSTCPEVESVSATGIETNGATIEWSAGTGDYAAHYEVAYATEPINDFATADKSQITDGLSATLTGLSAYTKYYVYVHCICDGEGQTDGDSWTSVPYVFRTLADCRVPSTPEATVTGKHTATVAWNNTSKGTQDNNFNYLLSTEAVDPSAVDADSTGHAYETVDLTDLASATTYHFYVQNVCSEGSSPWDSCQFTTPVAMPAVINLSADDVDYNMFTATWERDEANFADETAWNVACAEIGEEPTAWTTVNTTTFVQIGLQPATQYRFFVVPTDGENGGDTASIVVTTDDAPSACITLHDGTNNNEYVPVYGLYVDNYDKCQMVYPATEMQDIAGKQITGLTYYLQTPASDGWGIANFQVYLMEVPYTSISAYENVETNAAKVYEGSLDGTSSTMEITFSTPYTYNGGNLLVAVYNTVIGTYKSAKFYGEEVTGASVQGYSGSSLSEVTVDQRNFLPKTTFCTPEEECAQVRNLAVSDVTYNSANVSWLPGGSETEWEYVFGSEEITDFTGVTATATTSMNVALSGLAVDQDCYFYVRSVCNDTTASSWRKIYFTTTPSCSAPVGLYSYMITNNQAGMGANGGEYGTSASYNYEYWADGSDDTTRVNGGAFIIVSDLKDATYHWRAQVVCGEGEGASRWTYGDDLRACGVRDVPYVTNFSGMQYITEDCWNASTGNTSINDNKLPFVLSSNSTQIVALPRFENLNTLAVNLTYQSTALPIEIGYLTDANDLSNSFVSYETLPTTTSAYVDANVSLVDLPANAERIAIRAHNNNASSYTTRYAYIDSIRVAPAVNNVYYDTLCFNHGSYKEHGFNVKSSALQPGVNNKFQRVAAGEEADTFTIANVFVFGEMLKTHVYDTYEYDTRYQQPYIGNGFNITDPVTKSYSRSEIVHGCDSDIILHLTVDYVQHDVVNICEGATYNWRGYSELAETGVYEETLEDTTYRLTLTVNPTYTVALYDTICQGDVLDWYEHHITTAGTYTHVAQTVAGCDSTLNLTVKVNPSYLFEENRSIVIGSSFEWFGQTINADGTYYHNEQTVNGCDSNFIVHVTMGNEYIYDTVANICQGDFVTWRTRNFNADTVAVDSFKTAQGLDSIYRLTLHVNPVYSVSETAETCNNTPYRWHNRNYSKAGTYVDTLKSQYGCDSICTLVLTLNPTYLFTENRQICQGESYSWHQHDYTKSGTYYDSLKTVSTGCDSVYKLVLTVNPTYDITENATICDGQIFFWEGSNYTKAGVYTANFRTSRGCDSIRHLNLTVNPTYNIVINDTICEGTEYVWNGRTLTSTGVYYENLKTVSTGCDSIVTLKLYVKPAIRIAESINAPVGYLYSWRGQSGEVTESGIIDLYDTVPAPNGCDSLLSMSIITPTWQPLDQYDFYENINVCEAGTFNWRGKDYTLPEDEDLVLIDDTVKCKDFGDDVDSVYHAFVYIHTPSYDTARYTICDGETYVWRGYELTEAGVYTDEYVSQYGCDSVIALNLTVLPSYSSPKKIDVHHICDGDVFNWLDGKQYDVAGTYTATIKSSLGCDSAIRMYLVVHDKYLFERPDAEIFLLDTPYVWNDHDTAITFNFDKEGVYDIYDSLITQEANTNCDSVYHQKLTIKPTRTTVDTICDDETYSWRGNDYNVTGVYNDTVADVTGAGMDTIYQLVLTVNPSYDFVDTMVICASEAPYQWREHDYFETGIYWDSLQTAEGCDSVFKLVLTVNPIYDNSDSPEFYEICEGDTFHWEGRTFTRPNFYQYTLKTTEGCDSVVNFTLVVNKKFFFEDNAVICQTDTAAYTWHGQKFTESGIYWDSLQTIHGCDSVYKLNLTVENSYYFLTEDTICDRDTYLWQGRELTVAGTYFDSLVTTGNAVQQCDSIYELRLVVNPVYDFADTMVICASEAPYTWRGKDYSVTGIYWDSLKTAVGCDSVYKLDLTVNPTYFVAKVDSFCMNADHSYDWIRPDAEGVDYVAMTITDFNTGYNLYWDSLKTTEGCDSVFKLELYVCDTFLMETIDTVCSNHTYTWRGNDYDIAVAGDYVFYDSLTTAGFGCDSIYKLSLRVNQSYSNIVDTIYNLCAGEVVTWGKAHIRTYDKAGVYFDTVPTAGCGCDSIFMMSITYHDAFFHTETVTTCGDTYEWQVNADSVRIINLGGQAMVKDSAIFVDAFGCDSIYEMVVMSGSEYTHPTTTVTICEGETYNWRGNDYSTTGIVYDTISVESGCDTIYALDLTVNPIYSIYDTLTVCENELPYVWNNQVLRSAGDYVANLKTMSACDSTVSLHFNVNTKTIEPVETITICQDSSYTWYGKTYTEAGTYFDTLRYAGMACDSAIRTLNLNVYNRKVYTVSMSTCENSPLSWRGQTCSVAGEYRDTTYLSGCIDSIYVMNLTVNPTYLFEDSYTICEGESYNWHHRDLRVAGVYYDSLFSRTTGCDSIYKLTLTVNEVGSRTEYRTVCQSALPYIWFGQPYTVSGEYTTIKPSQTGGCDSIITLDLTVLMTDTVRESMTICQGDVYTWRDGQNYSAAGTYYYSVDHAQTLCDSVYYVLNLSVSTEKSSSETMTICSSATPFVWHSMALTQTGTYYDTLIARSGCDSVCILNLTVNASSEITDPTYTMCQGSVYNWRGMTITESGSYMQTVPSQNPNECETVYRVTVVVNPSYNVVDNQTICNGDAVIWHGQRITAAGTYYDNHQTVAGCDSNFTLVVTVNDPVRTQLSETICSGSSFTWKGVALTQAGVYYDTLVAANLCDSIVELTLTVTAPITTYEYVTYCDNETAGTEYEGYAAGEYHFLNTYTTAAGCDSIVDSLVTILPSYDLTEYDTLEVDKSLVWHGRTIIETTTGDYTYVDSALTIDGCDSVTTLYLHVTPSTGVEVISDVKMPIILAPNPIVIGMTTYVNRDWSEEEREGMYVEVVDNFGQVIDHFTPENFPIEVRGDVPSGIYHIRVVTGTQDVYVEKLIVK